MGVFPSFERQEAIVPMTKHMHDLGITIDIIAPFNETIVKESESPSSIQQQQSQQQPSQETRLGIYRFMLSNLTMPYPDGRVFHYHIDRQVRALVERSIRRLRALKVRVVEYDLSPVEVVKMLHLVFNKTQTMLKSVAECSDACRVESLDKYLVRLGQDAPYRSVETMRKSPSLSETMRKSLMVSSSNSEG